MWDPSNLVPLELCGGPKIGATLRFFFSFPEIQLSFKNV